MWSYWCPTVAKCPEVRTAKVVVEMKLRRLPDEESSMAYEDIWEVSSVDSPDGKGLIGGWPARRDGAKDTPCDLTTGWLAIKRADLTHSDRILRPRIPWPY